MSGGNRRGRRKNIARTAWIGAAVMLTVAIGSSMAFAANGKPFILGKGNVATKITKLVKKGAGPALDLRVESGAPLRVNSSAQVANLNADKVDGEDASGFLASDGKAADTDELDGLDSTAFGVTAEQAGVPSADCDTPNVFNECAKVEVVVPPGKTYEVTVSSSGAWATQNIQGIVYCPAARRTTQQAGAPPCITPGGVQQQITVEAGQIATGSASGQVTLMEGAWTLSTRVAPSAATISNSTANVITQVMVRDVAAAGPPIE